MGVHDFRMTESQPAHICTVMKSARVGLRSGSDHLNTPYPNRIAIGMPWLHFECLCDYAMLGSDPDTTET